MSIRTFRAAALLVAVIGSLPLGGGTRSAHAEEERSLRIASPNPLMTSLGHPAHQLTVDALVYRSLTESSPSPELLAETLGHAGGAAALAGLVDLIDRGTPEVRTAALRAMEQVDLRSEDAARRAVRHAWEGEGAERAAAALALGAVGDGRHVDLLLECTESPDLAVRQSAFRSLKKLMRLPIPPVRARWAWQWKVLQRRAARQLPEQLAALAEDPDGPAAPALTEQVIRYGWTDLALVNEYVSDWFFSGTTSTRALACRLVAGLRLADHASAVEGAARFAYAPDLVREVDGAIEALGLAARAPRHASAR